MGENVTEAVQMPPFGAIAPQFVTEKPEPGFVVNVGAALVVPVFVTVTGNELPLPTLVAGKVRLPGDTVKAVRGVATSPLTGTRK
jgi:hypothetical protein